jgi:hypothetical protein
MKQSAFVVPKQMSAAHGNAGVDTNLNEIYGPRPCLQLKPLQLATCRSALLLFLTAFAG